MIFSLVKTLLQKWLRALWNASGSVICPGGFIAQDLGEKAVDNRFGVGCHHQWDFRWPRNQPNMAYYNFKNMGIRPLPHIWVLGWSWGYIRSQSCLITSQDLESQDWRQKVPGAKKMCLIYASRPSGWWWASRKQVSQRLIGTMGTNRPR